MTKKKSLRETASAINAHLKRMEADPTINTKHAHGMSRYYNAGAWVAGRYIGVKYVSYQGNSYLPRETAEHYLERLNAGEQIKHFQT